MFDQQGIWIRRQWTEFENFVQQAKLDYKARMKHMEAERIRLRRYLSKLQLVDTLWGGTSLRGNPGASDTSPEDDPVPTQCGGDLAWKDDFVRMNLYHRASGTGWDADIASIVGTIKYRMIPIIKRRREDLEFEMKKTLDRIDQLRLEIQHLQILSVDGGGFDQLIEKVQQEFTSVAPTNLTKRPLTADQSPIGAANLKTKKEVPFVRDRKNLFEDAKTLLTREWPRITGEILESTISHIDGVTSNEPVRETVTVNPYSKEQVRERAAQKG